MTESIIYVGPYSFPDGGAAARRIFGNCCTLRELGYEIVITSGDVANEGHNNGEYEGFKVVSLNERTVEGLPKLLKHITYLNMGKKTIDWLNRLDSKPKAVILYSGYTPYLRHLLRWSKANKVPIIFDSVEWYQAKNKLMTFLSPYYLNIEFSMRYYSPKVKNVIVISRYLESHYESKNCNVVRIPPTLDTSIIAPVQRDKNNKLELAYAGSPGHKDLLNNILDAVLNIDEDGKTLQLNIAGITGNELLQYDSLKAKGYTRVPKVFNCKGMVSHGSAIRMVGTADFSVLLRPPEKYAMAGFPTKFVESMAVGTPIITNITSDLADYLHDGDEGLICADYRSQSIEKQIRYALDLTDADKDRMRLKARKRAELSFDNIVYLDSFKCFLGSLDSVS